MFKTSFITYGVYIQPVNKEKREQVIEVYTLVNVYINESSFREK